MADALKLIKWHIRAQEKQKIIKGSSGDVSRQGHAPGHTSGEGSCSTSPSVDEILGMSLYQVMV